MQTSLFYRSMRVVADFDHSIGKFTVTVENAAPYSVLIYGENKAHLRRVFEEAVRRAYPLHDLLSQELTRIYEHD
jgi:SpoVK/Ycf46/Vps4 family AAA+-type ATPase